MEDDKVPAEPQEIEVSSELEAPEIKVDAEQPAGVPEGTELPNEHGIEVVVHDENGWHKELKEEQ